MNYRVLLELTLPDFAHVHLIRHVAVPYVDVLEILQVGLTCPGDVSERVGTLARLLEALPERADPDVEEVVTDRLGFIAYANLRFGNTVVRHKQEGRWMIGGIPGNIFRDNSTSSVWIYLHANSNPLPHSRG